MDKSKKVDEILDILSKVILDYIQENKVKSKSWKQAEIFSVMTTK